MKMLRDFILSTVIASILVAAGWYTGSYSQGSVDRISSPSLAIPSPSQVRSRNEWSSSAFESGCFADFSRARLLKSHAHYDSLNPQSKVPDSLIEVHQVPLVSHDDVKMSLQNRVLSPRPIDHVLLVVERTNSDRLLDAKVLGAYYTHTSSTDVIPTAIVEIQETKKLYIVTAMKATNGLELRIHSRSRGSSIPDTWKRLSANPSARCLISLEQVSSTQIKIPGLHGEVSDFSAAAVTKEGGLHLEISLRGSAVERRDVLCRQSYSIKSNKWSSIPYSPFEPTEQYDANAPWQFVQGSSKICEMRVLQDQSQNKPMTGPQCVAIVEQSYRYLPSKHGTGRAFWVVKCSPDGKLKDAVPFGVIYPECPLFQPGGGFCDFSTALVYQPELDHCFVVTSGHEKSGCGLFVHRCRLAKPLVIQGLELTADPKKWPVQMEQISELPMHVLRQETSIESASLSSKTNDEDASLIVTMKPDNNWGESWQETCRYNFRTSQWTTTKQKIDAKARPQE